MIYKLRWSCHLLRSIVQISNINILNSIYCAYIHSIINIEYISWGNSSNSGKILPLQKKIFRIMASAQFRSPCRSLFKELEILPVLWQYALSLLNFIINNQEMFPTYSFIHNINTSSRHHVHRPKAKLTCFRKKYTLCRHKNFQRFTT